MPLRVSRPSARRVRAGAVGLACVVVGVILAALIVPQRFSNAATTPTVDCTTDPAIFNTGYSVGTETIAGTAATEERWTAAGGLDGFNHGAGGVNNTGNAPTGPLSAALPPLGATFTNAYVGKVNNSWLDSPFGNAQWISQNYAPPSVGQNQNPGWGDFYFKYTFTLSPAVNPANFELKMDWYADNTVRGVWVNDVLKKQTTLNPYQGMNYLPGKQVSTTLAGFKTGQNTILVQVGSTSTAVGFLAQVTSTALCPSLTVGKAVDGRVDASDQFVVAAAESNGDVVTSATTAGADATATSAKVFVAPGKTYTITDSMAAGSPSGSELYRGTLTCTDLIDGTSIPVSGSYPTWTVTIPGFNDYGCTVTNTTHTFTVDKAVSAATAHPGEKVTYTVTVTNTGKSAFTAADPASFTDDLTAILDDASYNDDASSGARVSGGILSWSGPLPVGGTATITYSFTMKDAGSGDGDLRNVVTGGPSCHLSCTPGVTTKARSFSLSKKASSPSAELGDKVTYTITVANTGADAYTAASPAGFTDDLTDVLDDAVYNGDATGGAKVTGKTLSWSGPLPVGQSVTITYSVTVNKPASGDRQLRNAVIPTVPGGACIPSECETQTKALDPALTLTKTADASTIHVPAKAGDTILYHFTVTNEGNVTMSGVRVNDPLLGTRLTYAWPGAEGILEPGQSATASASYAVTQADIDEGHRANSATADATASSGQTLETPPAETDTPLVAAPSIDVTKSADVSAVSSPAKAGDTVTYHFTATNTGNVTLSKAAIDDKLTGLSELTYVWPGSQGVLRPGETVTAAATYQLTQADVDAGHVSNTATAGATPPTGARVSDQASADVALTVGATIGLVKSADTSTLSTPPAAGDTVTYRFTASNTGTVTLTGVSIADPLPDLSPLTYVWPAAQGVLAPGEQVSASATYLIKQSDIDAGTVHNTATATGTPPSGAAVTAEDSQDVRLAAGPAIGLVKAADDSTLSSSVKTGDTVTYRFTATNTGNVSLRGVVIQDPLQGLTALTYTWPGAEGVLAPGEGVTATATYQLKQSDLDAGHVSNTATGTGTSPSGAEVSDTATADVPLAAGPALDVVKTADASQVSTPPTAGDVIVYHFTATNRGNVTMSGVVIEDALPGLSAMTYSWPGADGVLAPGQAVTATATYRITQSDIDAGAVRNSAIATGTPPAGPPVTSPPSDVVVELPAASRLELEKAADTSEVSSPALPGDTVTYRFTATNSGNVTLTGVVITDPLAGLSALAYVWPGAPGVLAPGEVVSATATYPVTQADLDAGHVDNLATGAGTDPSGKPVSDTGSADVPLAVRAAIGLVKTADTAAVASPAMAGDTVTYRFVGTNSGNVTLAAVQIHDPLKGLAALEYVWPGTEGVLPPGASVTATATYALTQADIDAGQRDNTATITGTAPDGAAMTADASATVPLAATGVVELLKKADDSALGAPARPGDTITYRFEGTNNGNVTVTEVTIVDALAGLSDLSYTWPGAPGVLAPGETVTAAATYQLTQADIDAGHVHNTATVTASPPSGEELTDESSVDVVVPPAPSMKLQKTAETSALSSPAKAGDTVTYHFTGTNTGNTTLTDVTVADPLDGLSDLEYSWPGVEGVLAPGDSVTATARYRLTQADLDGGQVDNTATVTGTAPAGDAVTAEASADVRLAPSAAIDLQKTADSSAIGSPAKPGDVITYHFVGTNVGTVTVRAVVVTDGLEGLSELSYAWPGEEGVLAPGEAVTATASYPLTQADIDAGHVENRATVTATPPSGEDVTDESTADVPVAGTSELTVLKEADATAIGSPARPGDTVRFRFTVTNTGTLTMADVTVEDRLPGLSQLTYVWPGAPGVLAPGQSAIATASYQLKESDLAAGHVANKATARGTAPNGDPTQSPPAEVDTPLPRIPLPTVSG